MSYQLLVEHRNIDVDGVNQWMWPKSDTGAFGSAKDGPMRDWLEGHKSKYFTNVRQFDTIVTAGANCGMYTRFYSQLFKHVYAFEPDPLNFHCMVNNNQFDNVIKFNCALGDKNGTVGLNNSSKSNVGTHSIKPDIDSRLYIQMLTIDSLNLEALDCIQLDVEGYELPCINGALQSIARFKPVIITEKKQDEQFMQSLGYKYQDQSYSDFIYIPN